MNRERRLPAPPSPGVMTAAIIVSGILIGAMRVVGFWLLWSVAALALPDIVTPPTLSGAFMAALATLLLFSGGGRP